MYLQILFSCIDGSNSNTKKLEEKDLKIIDKHVEELETITLQYELVRKQEKELTQEEKDYIIHSEAFKNWSGKRYDIFEVQHHKDLLECLKEEFRATYNFSIDDLCYGITKLKNNFYFEFEDSINAVKSLLKKGKVKIDKDGIFNIPMKFGSDNKKQVEEYLENIYTLKLADIQENTKWTKKFLDKFIIEQKEYKKFIDNISIENWNNLLNKIKYRPLIYY